MASFDLELADLVKKHFGDAPNGAAVIVYSAVLDSGVTESFRQWARDAAQADDWRAEPTMEHDVMFLQVQNGAVDLEWLI